METTPCDSDLDLDMETRTPLRHEPWGQQLGIGSEFFIIRGGEDRSHRRAWIVFPLSTELQIRNIYLFVWFRAV